MAPTVDVDAMIKAGTHHLCPVCRGALIPVTRQHCSGCDGGSTLRRLAPSGRSRAARTRVKVPTVGAETRIEQQRIRQLSEQADGVLWLVALGKPITQGSMKMRGKQVVHSSGDELHEWRNSITREALRTVGQQWQPVDAPLRIDAMFTVPAPRTGPAGVFVCEEGNPRMAPMGPPDSDKLLRAAQDALSPNQKGREGSRFLLVKDDSRFVDSSSGKTFPAPGHTHPWALSQPGVVIRVAPLGEVDPMPASTLGEPGPLPARAAELEEQCRRRRGR